MIRIISLVLIALLAAPIPARAQDYTSGLVGHWKLDETGGTTATDSSGNGNAGTLNNFPASPWTTGKRDGALTFDDVDSYVTIANESFFDFQYNQPFTLAAWIYRNNNTGDDEILGKVDPNNNTRGYTIWMAPGSDWLHFNINNTGGGNRVEIRTTNAVSSGTWHHIVATYSGTGAASGAAIYVDGVAVGTTTISSTLGTSNILHNEPLVIGNCGSWQGNCVFNGIIDDARIYGRALSAADVEALYNSWQPGKIRYNTNWRAPEYYDGARWIAMGNTRYVPNAVTFDGTNDYLTHNAAIGANSKLVTGSFWFRRAGGHGARRYIYRVNGGTTYNDTNARFLIEFDASNRIHLFGRLDTSNIVLNATSAATFGSSDTNWHHVMFSIDLANASNRHLYIDGAADSATWSTYANNNINFAVGTPRLGVGADFAGGSRFNGDLADFYLDVGTYTDLSDAGNRRKFYNSGPVYLGTNGSLPTGTAPEVFLSSSTDAWHTNKGSSTGFTEVGALTDATLDPGDVPSRDISLHGSVTHATLNNATQVAVQGNFAYVTGYDNDRLTVVDISNPASPTVRGNVSNGTILNEPIAVAVSGNYVYVLSSGYFVVIDVSDPDNPAIVDNIFSNTYFETPRGIAISGNFAYVTSLTQNRLTVVDISTPTSPTVRGSVQDATNLFFAGNIAVSGNYAYVLQWGDNRFTIVNISDPDAPTVTGYVESGGALQNNNGAIAIQGNYAYVAADAATDDLTIINISNPASPVIVGELYIGTVLDEPIGIAVDGNYAYVAAYTGDAVGVFDVSNPANPFLIETITHANLNGANYMIKSGDYLYIPAYDADRLTVVRTTPPQCASPSRPVGSIIYNTTSDQMQFCNGEDWIEMGPPGNGGGGCNNPSGTEGQMVFNSTYRRLQYCEGSDWILVGRDPYTPPTDGLINHWKLDETSGTTANDSGSLNMDGTLEFLNFSGDSAPGRVGNALQFDGTDQKRITADTQDNMTEFTACLWFRPDSPMDGPDNETYVTFLQKSWSMGIDLATNLLFFEVPTSGSYAVVGSNTAIVPNQWYHACFIHNGIGDDDPELYLQGVQDATGWAGNGTQNNDGGSSLYIGAEINEYGANFNGRIDDVRIYNRALSADEIYHLYRGTGGL